MEQKIIEAFQQKGAMRPGRRRHRHRYRQGGSEQNHQKDGLRRQALLAQALLLRLEKVKQIKPASSRGSSDNRSLKQSGTLLQTIRTLVFVRNLTIFADSIFDNKKQLWPK